MLGTQNVLGTPREPFSHLLYKKSLFVYDILCKHDWEDEKRMYKLVIFVFERMNPLPTYLSMEGKDQNAVVRLKEFQNMSGFILKQKP